MNTLGLVVRVKARVGCSAQPDSQFDASNLDGSMAVLFGYRIRSQCLVAWKQFDKTIWHFI